MIFSSLLLKNHIVNSNHNHHNNIIVRYLRKKPLQRLPVPRQTKRLDCVIIGEPNAGKSVLLNSILKERLAAATRKKHTTRLEILGVFNHRNVQLAFYDTPGYIALDEARKTQSKVLRNVAVNATNKADVVMIIVDAAKDYSSNRNQKSIIAFCEMVKLGLQNAKDEIILILNKVDLVKPKTKLLELTRQLVSLINGIKLGADRKDEAILDTTTFMIAALKNDGVIDLKNYLIASSKPRHWIIPKDAGITDLSREDRVEQMVLESMLENTHEEIPYMCDINCTSIKMLTQRRIEISVDIFVDTEKQRRIVIGQGGRTLLSIRQFACSHLEDIFKKQVILYLWIKLRNDNDKLPEKLANNKSNIDNENKIQSINDE